MNLSKTRVFAKSKEAWVMALISVLLSTRAATKLIQTRSRALPPLPWEVLRGPPLRVNFENAVWQFCSNHDSEKTRQGCATRFRNPKQIFVKLTLYHGPLISCRLPSRSLAPSPPPSSQTGAGTGQLDGERGGQTSLFIQLILCCLFCVYTYIYIYIYIYIYVWERGGRLGRPRRGLAFSYSEGARAHPLRRGGSKASQYNIINT